MWAKPSGPDPDREEREVRQGDHDTDLEHEVAPVPASSRLILRLIRPSIPARVPNSLILT
jgi:hypothetical protein